MEAKDRICPTCGGPLGPGRRDDAGTLWFKCQKCGKETNKPQTASSSTSSSNHVHETSSAKEELKETYGFSVRKTKTGYVLFDSSWSGAPAEAVYTFKNLTSAKVRRELVEKTGAPDSLVDRLLAELSLEREASHGDFKQDVQVVEPKQADSDPVTLEHLTMMEDPDVANKLVNVEAIVSSTSLAYMVSSELDVQITDKDGHESCESVPIGEKNTLNMKLAGVNEDIKTRRLRRYVVDHVGETGKLKIEEKTFRTVYKVRVRPPVFTLEKQHGKIVDEKGFEYKAYDIYVSASETIRFQPSSLIRLQGTVVPNPRTQNVTILAHRADFPEDVHYYNDENLAKLQKRFAGLSACERMKWILDNFEAYSQIRRRRNLAEAGLLTFFSSLRVKLNGEEQRGWANTAILGDTTTAKTETIRKFMKLLRAGVLITAETASTVGLVGTATQIEKGEWFIDWGFLTLSDQKLLAVDGAHKLPKGQWAALAESERSGVVTIAKAAKDSAYARTRQIKIANAVDQEADKFSTKSLSSFLYQAQALATVFDKTSIARLDCAVFADSRDVKAEDVNEKRNADFDRDLELMADSLKWCWSNQAEIVFTPEAVDRVLAKATKLYNTFFCESVPLVSIDMKWKLARLAAAAANATLSTTDFKTVTVTKEHVDIVASFMEEEYAKAGLNTLAQETKFETFTEEDLDLIFSKTCSAANIAESLAHEIVRFIVIQGHVTRDQIKEKYNLAENKQLRPLLATLQSEKLLRSSRGLYPTPRMIEAYKLLSSLTSVTRSEKDPQQKLAEKTETKKLGGSLPDLVKPVNLDKREDENPPTVRTELSASGQADIDRVLGALAKASKERGSAHISEIVLESGLPEASVLSLLKQLERQNKVSEPYQDYWKVLSP